MSHKLVNRKKVEKERFQARKESHGPLKIFKACPRKFESKLHKKMAKIEREFDKCASKTVTRSDGSVLCIEKEHVGAARLIRMAESVQKKIDKKGGIT